MRPRQLLNLEHLSILARVVAVAASSVACGGQAQMAVGTSAPAMTTGGAAMATAPPSLAPSTLPDVELREPSFAVVGGQRIAFDGVAEGLEWPSLQKALPKKSEGPVVVQVAREVPIVNVLRAVFVLRTKGVRLQTPDERGAMYVVELAPRREPAVAPAPNAEGPKPCHLAVFVQPSGTLRIATSAGPQESPNADSFARALDAARSECALRYVAFGAESNDVPWGAVFDVIVAVDRAKAAGPARYVLAEAVHPPKR